MLWAAAAEAIQTPAWQTGQALGVHAVGAHGVIEVDALAARRGRRAEGERSDQATGARAGARAGAQRSPLHSSRKPR